MAGRREQVVLGWSAFDGSWLDTIGTVADNVRPAIDESQDPELSADLRRGGECGGNQPLVGQHLQGGRKAECAGQAALRGGRLQYRLPDQVAKRIRGRDSLPSQVVKKTAEGGHPTGLCWIAPVPLGLTPELPGRRVVGEDQGHLPLPAAATPQSRLRRARRSAPEKTEVKADDGGTFGPISRHALASGSCGTRRPKSEPGAKVLRLMDLSSSATRPRPLEPLFGGEV